MRTHRQLVVYHSIIVQNNRGQLKEELDQPRKELGLDRSGWGALGQVAEFLVSQRGLRV